MNKKFTFVSTFGRKCKPKERGPIWRVNKLKCKKAKNFPFNYRTRNLIKFQFFFQSCACPHSSLQAFKSRKYPEMSKKFFFVHSLFFFSPCKLSLVWWLQLAAFYSYNELNSSVLRSKNKHISIAMMESSLITPSCITDESWMSLGKTCQHRHLIYPQLCSTSSLIKSRRRRHCVYVHTILPLYT